MTTDTMSPTAVSDVVKQQETLLKQEEVVASVPDVQPSEEYNESETVLHKSVDSTLPSFASLETQPTLHYNSSVPQTQSIDYPYEFDKNSSYSSSYTLPYPYDGEQYQPGTVDSTKLVQVPQVDSQPTQNVNLVKSNPEDAEKFQHDLTDPNVQQLDPVVNYLNPVYSPEGLVKPQNKVVAVNPVILVDKVERSLIVQWYENSVKREQRISYKKYGNAKAQQRAEGLINKLLSGSTFDQLYPEKGPPILTIFENVGKYMVSLTRDRIIREWRVDWLNSNGSKMRARWSCKKVGNEEARKRAEAFAYSLIQGTFNPRLLHKATGTRLSKNDMKYNSVVSSLDSQIESKAISQLSESGCQNMDLTSKRRAKKRSVKSSDQKKSKSRKRNLSLFTDVNSANSLSTSGSSTTMLSTGNLASNTLNATGMTNTLQNPLTTNNSSDMSHYLKSHCYPYMNMVQDPNFPTNLSNYYPMYQEECESSNSVNQQMDPNLYTSSMMQQGWMDWSNNNLQKPLQYGQEWDYTTNPQMPDYQYYPQQNNSNISSTNTNMNSNLPWDPLNNYANMNMYMHQNELSTGREFEEQGDNRLPNQFFGYYGNDQVYGFQDNMLNQDQLMMAGYFNYPNNVRMDGNTQWQEDNKDFSKFKEYTGEFPKEYTEETKQEEVPQEKDLSQVTTLANYKNIACSNLSSSELPPANLSVTTRMYTADHYGYINSELGDLKQEDPSLNCFSNELEDPLQSQTINSQLSQTLSTNNDYPLYQKDKFAETYDNVTYRDMEEPVKYYTM